MNNIAGSGDVSDGFVFDKFDQYAFFGTLVRAMEAYKYKIAWRRLQRRAMSADFSWDMSAKKYENVFEKALAVHIVPPGK